MSLGVAMTIAFAEEAAVVNTTLNIRLLLPRSTLVTLAMLRDFSIVAFEFTESIANGAI